MLARSCSLKEGVPSPSHGWIQRILNCPRDHVDHVSWAGGLGHTLPPILEPGVRKYCVCPSTLKLVKCLISHSFTSNLIKYQEMLFSVHSFHLLLSTQPSRSVISAQNFTLRAGSGSVQFCSSAAESFLNAINSCAISLTS